MTFHLMFVHIIIVTEWPSFGKELLPRLTICSLWILTLCNLSYFLFWFEGWIWILIASVPDFCILFTFVLNVCCCFRVINYSNNI